MNYILINPDEMRHNVLGCYGNEAAVTPHIDQLAHEGTLFENCFVQNSVCTPSRISFLTGLYPHNRGHRTLWHTLGPDEPNLFRTLKENGYAIHIWGKNDAFSPEALALCATTINKHHDMSNYSYHSKRRNPLGELGDNSFLYENEPTTIKENKDYGFIKEAINFLKSKPENPFCVYLALDNPHPPYKVNDDFIDTIDMDKIPELIPYMKDGTPDFHGLIRDYRGLDQLDNAYLKEIMKVYLGMTTMVDWMVGQLLHAVEAYGYDQNTTIIFFSDHGDYAGDYGLVEKWPSGFEDALLHIPFIVKAPGYKKGNVMKAPIETFDMVATILELSNIDPHYSHFSKSLVPQLEGVEGDLDRTVFAEGGYDESEPHCFEGYGVGQDIRLDEDMDNIYYPKVLQQQEVRESVCRSVMARNLNYKLVRRSSGKHAFYDLHNDPQELHNVYGVEAYWQQQYALENKLMDWYLTTSDTVPYERQIRHFDPAVSMALNKADNSF
ncbi:sulfatase-like hydrolase/transferase [Vallitalea pronyensis]|uniref:Sulfatase-like hydrolase/transferase n=1 Tax=Vallitalea pronyensis TaxID=1348613 RepID=A0A8J8SFA0_9FIRM|nr:sulfatase-like hydrolase/transferase [Vallitalea pronyensis]QUI21028.1 sulfatase-like hydrolase/transferase [Vallitalea pronyensis]